MSAPGRQGWGSGDPRPGRPARPGTASSSATSPGRDRLRPHPPPAVV